MDRHTMQSEYLFSRLWKKREGEERERKRDRDRERETETETEARERRGDMQPPPLPEREVAEREECRLKVEGRSPCLGGRESGQSLSLKGTRQISSRS